MASNPLRISEESLNMDEILSDLNSIAPSQPLESTTSRQEDA